MSILSYLNPVKAIDYALDKSGVKSALGFQNPNSTGAGKQLNTDAQGFTNIQGTGGSVLGYGGNKKKEAVATAMGGLVANPTDPAAIAAAHAADAMPDDATAGDYAAPTAARPDWVAAPTTAAQAMNATATTATPAQMAAAQMQGAQMDAAHEAQSKHRDSHASRSYRAARFIGAAPAGAASAGASFGSGRTGQGGEDAPIPGGKARR